MKLRASIGFGALNALAAASCLAAGAGGGDALRAFSTDGHTVYHLRCAKLRPGGERAIVAAALDGAVMCFTPAGEPLWENRDSDAFPLDLEVADIDGDGRDEILVAAAERSTSCPPIPTA